MENNQFHRAEYQSTPNGRMCARLMQISMMSFSEMEASNGVPSPHVMVTNSNLFREDSGDGTSRSLDAVADEVMDIMGRQKLLFYLLRDVAVSMDPAGSH